MSTRRTDAPALPKLDARASSYDTAALNEPGYSTSVRLLAHSID